MEECTEKLKNGLGADRSCTKEMFKMVGSIYRGVTKGRFTLEEVLKILRI